MKTADGLAWFRSLLIEPVVVQSFVSSDEMLKAQNAGVKIRAVLIL